MDYRIRNDIDMMTLRQIRQTTDQKQQQQQQNNEIS